MINFPDRHTMRRSAQSRPTPQVAIVRCSFAEADVEGFGQNPRLVKRSLAHFHQYPG